MKPLLGRTDWLAPRSDMEAFVRAHAMAIPFGSERLLCRVLGHFKLACDRNDLSLTPHLALDGYWEYWLTRFAVLAIRPGDVVIDAGANLGYYSVLFGHLAGADGQVVAFEPDPANFELARINLQINGMWERSALHATALGDDSQAELILARVEGHSANSHLNAWGHGLRVPVATLDAACPGPAQFVKIDVEGMEEAVWRGMQGLLARSPDVIVVIEVNGERCRDLPGLLRSMEAAFPLRELTHHGTIEPVRMQQVLGRRHDTLMCLTRRSLDTLE
jgi:FkbM family methyltransferase